MKKIFFLCFGLLLCFALLFSSCNENGGNTTDPPQNDGISEEDQIKQNALDLMQANDEKQAPTDLFSHFDGDYEIMGVTKTTNNVNSVKRKNAVSVISTNNSSIKYYGVEAAGYFFYAMDSFGSAFVEDAFPLAADDASKSTVFTAFGIDTSALYGTEEEEDSFSFTADMLSVSEDKSTCTFSKESMDAFARTLCEAMEYTEEQTDSFLEKYSGSGIYSVAENKVTFELSINDPLLGILHQTIEFAIDDDQTVTTYSYLEYSNPILGISKPIISEISCEDVVYRGNEPISGSIKTKSSRDTSYYDGDPSYGFFIQAEKTVVATFTFDCSDAERPYCTAEQETTTTESYKGKSSTRTRSLSLTVDQRELSSQFSFEESVSGRVENALKAHVIVFGTPSSFPTVPTRITTAISQYIYVWLD